MDIRDGELLPNSQLELTIHDEGNYQINQGAGSVIVIESQSKGSLFRTDQRYVEALLIGLPVFPSKSEKINLPGKDIKILYQAGAQSVIFKASTAEGHIIFNEANKSDKQVSGVMHLKMKNELKEESFPREVSLDFKFVLTTKN